MTNKFKIDFLSFLLFIALIIIAAVSFIPAFLGKDKQTTSSFAQNSCEGWRCPGNQCDKCGSNGWWDQGCWDFCAGNRCSQSQGACSPCGDISLYCRNSEQGSCIKAGYRCGNDSCGHPDSACGSIPTSTPVPTLAPTTGTLPTNGPTPTLGPSPTTSPGTTIYPPTESPSFPIDPDDPSSYFLGLFWILAGGIGIDTQNTQPIPTLSPDLTPQPTLPPSGNQGVAAIIELVQNIQAYCSGRLVASDINCLNDFSMDPVAKSYLVSSVIAYGEAQCAEWAKNNALLLGNAYWGSIGNAMNLKNAPPPSGYIFIPKSPGNLQVGDHPVLAYGTDGHTGTVTEVLDPMNFRFAEANFDFEGGIRIRNFRMTFDNSDQLLGWIRKL